MVNLSSVMSPSPHCQSVAADGCLSLNLRFLPVQKEFFFLSSSHCHQVIAHLHLLNVGFFPPDNYSNGYGFKRLEKYREDTKTA